MLPDGRRLSDPRHRELKSALQLAVRAYRDGLGTEKIPALSTWLAFYQAMRGLAIWVVLHEARFCPFDVGLAFVDKTALRGLMTQLGRGGWTEAHQVIPRALRSFYSEACGRECPSDIVTNPMHLPLEVRESIVRWLMTEKAFGSRSKGLISRKFIAKKIKCDLKSLSGTNARLSAFFRQFEAGVNHAHGLLTTTNSANEFQDRGVPLLSEASQRSTTFGPAKGVASHLVTLAKLHRLLPKRLIPPTEIDIADLKSYGRTNSVAVKQTAFIPFDIASKHVAEAVHWVLHYGDALVDYYLAVVGETNRRIAPYACKASARRDRLPEILDMLPAPLELSRISCGFRVLAANTVGSNHHKSLRERPTIQQALEILVGAIAVLIGILKPCRVSELTSVRRDCLSHKDGFYYLDTRLAKRTVGEYSADSGPKPIPNITAKAVMLVQKLGNGLVALFDEQDPFQRGALFYLPSRLSEKAKVLNARVLDRYLDMFVDYVAYPPDEYGRRWYLRVHQLRRWFLLHMYWTGRSGAVDACVFMAGHTDALHILSYVTLECAGEQMESLEALFVMDQLQACERAAKEEKGAITLLKKTVLEHFDAASLDLIPARQFQMYLGELIESGQFAITPSTILDADGETQYEIGFRFAPYPQQGDANGEW